jgi:Amt family ammonium transporter
MGTLPPNAADVLFLLLGAIMILAMHAGFAFLELGTVRKKNQVNALAKILSDFAVSAIAYFAVGYSVAYGVNFFAPASALTANHGYELVKFFFLLTFAAAIPAIISGGIAERAKFSPQAFATFALVGLVYPFFEGIAWNNHFGLQDWLTTQFGAPFHDFAGSVVVHAVGGWIALAAVLLLGPRHGRYHKSGSMSAHPPSSIPFLALGAWILIVGWFGFNVMSAQKLDGMSGLVAMNSLMALVGGTLTATRPASGPLCRKPGSFLPSQLAVSVPPTMAISELMATSPEMASKRCALMTLKPNQPTIKIHEPRARNGIEEGG